ncbi:MAG: 23S rRNA (uracil(1939)-C(5))-methyltransferase RlmD [Deltaproteobacteria bacterium]|nr:MAG: 23S rRNA (uracil(1939)-C(5))-methyltransferase RlmD [Deltaproteobacteria bacterium]
MNRIVKVIPERWTRRGEAAKDKNGRTLVIWGAIPGEKAEVKLVHEGQNQDFGLFEGTPEPSPFRQDIPCDRYSVCGGCPWMHLSAEGQESSHRDVVREKLDEVGLANVALGEWFASPDGLEEFRHVIKVGVGKSDQGSLRVGAWGRRDRRIVPIPNCNVAHPSLTATMRALAHHVRELKLWQYEPETDRGVLRSAILRRSRTSGEILVTLIAGRWVKSITELAEAVSTQVPDVAGFWVHFNDDPGNAIFRPDDEGVIRCRPVLGKETIEEELCGVRYAVGPTDFFQTNPAVAELLYKRVIERLDLTRETSFVDLYCGVGGYALQAAPHVGFAIGVEENQGAVLRARDAAQKNGRNAEFVAGQVLDVLPEIGKRLAGRRPVVTVNPARRGLESGVIEGILELRPRQIAYVSCNPAALARDLAAFAGGGYTIEKVDLFDMFPNTPHVETLTILNSLDEDEGPERAPRRKVVRKK